MIEYIIKYYGILFENKSMIHHKKVCQYTFEKKMYYLVHSKSNIRGNVCQTYLMYVSIPMFFPDVGAQLFFVCLRSRCGQWCSSWVFRCKVFRLLSSCLVVVLLLP